MSSITADFDFVAEFSNPMLFNMLQSQVQIAGQPLNPPFEVEIFLFGDGLRGNAHMIVDDVTLDLNADDTIALDFVFGSASIDIFSGLDGNFTVTAPVMLVGSGSSRSIGVNFAN